MEERATLEMILKNYYWYFKSAIPHKICDEIIKYGNSLREEQATVGRELDQKDLKKIRNSNVTWLSDRWIYKEIQPYIHTANKNAEWNFEWDFSEACQFTKYKLNQFYNWHADSFSEPYAQDHPNVNLRGKIRKLSVTCSLSDSSEYEGGALEFDCRADNPKQKRILECKEIMSKGSIVVFPSFVWHRVKPVTKGVRYSLVIWNCGYPFK